MSFSWADDNSLLFDGQRITDDQTAADLDIEDGDSIEVLLERKYSSPSRYLRNDTDVAKRLEVNKRFTPKNEVGKC